MMRQGINRTRLGWTAGLLLAFAASSALGQTIATIAGNPAMAPGFSGDNGPATMAQLDRPAAVATDSQGHIFISDQVFNVVREFTPGGTIQTVAGMGGLSGGFGGDNAAATGASLSAPAGLAVDAKGNVYVADAANARIRMFTPGGNIITIAGGGNTSGADGLGDGGGATLGKLDFPQGVALDGKGNIYIADTFDSLVRVFTIAGTISVAAGTPGSHGFSGDGGPATASVLASPAGIALDAKGRVYIADNGAQVIRRFTPGGTIETIAGTANQAGYGGDGGPASAALLNEPGGVAVDAAGNVLIADTGNGVVRKIAPNGVITTLAGGGANAGSDGFGDGGPAPLAILALPGSVAADGSGNILVADTENSLIRRFSASVPPPSLVASVLPGARSVLNTSVATIFATMVNASSASLDDCQIALPSPTTRLLQLDFQSTNPATNALTGTQDMAVTIPANGAASFLLSFSAVENTGAVTALPGQQLLFACDGVDPAATTQGVNTVDLSFSPTPVADVIALAAVAGNTGILSVPTGGTGAFAVASANVGATDMLTISADTGSTTLPLQLTICATNAEAQCLNPAVASVTTSIASGSVPTFSIFATATAPIPFAPATSRIFVRFEDASGASHGSTSVAVETH
jgi:sugar lactone lactonase YvrE